MDWLYHNTMAKNIKQPVTCEVYINGMLHRVLYENRVIYLDAKGKRFIRDSLKGKIYLHHNSTYRVDVKTGKMAESLIKDLTK